MNKYYVIGGGVLLLIVAFVMINGNGGGKATSQQPASAQQTQAVATATSSSTATPSGTQNAEDIVPGLYPNPIQNTATTQGFKISSILVENNTDAAGNAVSDHLQFTLKNLTGKTITNLEAYYSIVDAANGKKEGYYKQLTGFSLPPYGSGTVNFDGKSGYGHYGVNMHGIYGTAVDKLQFKVEVSAPGYAPVYATATKAPGGAEVVGQ